jgi:hypothetical protein
VKLRREKHFCKAYYLKKTKRIKEERKRRRHTQVWRKREGDEERKEEKEIDIDVFYI